MPIGLFNQYSLPDKDEDELLSQHGAEIQQMLPVLGPLFGLVVLLFNVWDYLIDPKHALMTLGVRFVLVFIGAAAYWKTQLKWTAVQRAGHIYWTHAGAIIISEFLLTNGFLYGLAGIVACVFAVSVVTLRIKTFLQILSVPTFLFVTLNALRLPLFDFLNNLMLYIFAIGLAIIVMLALRYFRQKTFLLEKKLLDVSRHDFLTGALSRGYLIELAEREVALAKRHGRPLAVAMIDIDHFKKINDGYGHAIGDEVIKQLVRTCKDNLREIDHFGRIGGEEFVAVLPETDEAEAMICAERLRRSIEAVGIDAPQGHLQFTISIGVAVLGTNNLNWQKLLNDADVAMYRAKRDGRNRAVLAQSHPVQAS